MPIPKPIDGENETEFISRCMSDDTMVSEYDNEQRMAICSNVWNEKNVKTNQITLIIVSRHDEGNRQITSSCFCLTSSTKPIEIAV